MSEPSATLVIVLERLHDDVVLPARATTGSAGFDVRAYLRARTVQESDGVTRWERPVIQIDGEWSVDLLPGHMLLVPLGFRTKLPASVEAQVRPRSGLAFKHALTIANSPGTVDADYAEEWMVIIRNDGPATHRIIHGERIAQVVFAPLPSVRIAEGAVIRSTERAGGFGSTGTA